MWLEAAKSLTTRVGNDGIIEESPKLKYQSRYGKAVAQSLARIINSAMIEVRVWDFYSLPNLWTKSLKSLSLAKARYSSSKSKVWQIQYLHLIYN